MPTHPTYTLEQAEEELSQARGSVDVLGEALTQPDTNLTPNTPATGHIMYANSSHAMYASADTGVYNIGRNTVYCVHDGNVVSSTSQVAISQMGPISVGVGFYLIIGSLFANQGSTTATQAVRFTTTATLGYLALGWQTFEGGGVLSSGVAAAVGDDMSFGSLPANTVGELHIHGSAQFTTTGVVQLAQRCVTSGSDTWHVKLGSVLSVMPITTPQGS